MYDYARLNLETDLSDLFTSDQMNSKKIDVYVASVKQTVLPVSSHYLIQYYKNSWTIVIEALSTLMMRRKDIDFTAFSENITAEVAAESKIFNLLYGLCIDSISKIGSKGSYSVQGGQSSDQISKSMMGTVVSCLKCIQNLLSQISITPEIMSKVSNAFNMKRMFLWRP